MWKFYDLAESEVDVPQFIPACMLMVRKPWMHDGMYWGVNCQIYLGGRVGGLLRDNDFMLFSQINTIDWIQCAEWAL